jgi:hypothetical protein
LREALAHNPDLEFSRRVERLLAKVQGETLRTGRALEVLEQAGDDAASRLLKTLAQGAPQAQRTRDAQAALERLRW